MPTHSATNASPTAKLRGWGVAALACLSLVLAPAAAPAGPGDSAAHLGLVTSRAAVLAARSTTATRVKVTFPATWNIRSKKQIRLSKAAGTTCTTTKWRRSATRQRNYLGFTLGCRTRVGREAPILTIADKRHPTNPLTVAVPAATPSPRAAHAGNPTDYAFTFTQAADPGSPVAWDPCEPVDVAVNLNGTPAAELDLIQLALNRVAAATGLTVRDAGLTTLINEDDLRVGQEGTDIIFAFSSRGQNPTLARVPEDNVVGYATFGSGPEDPTGWSWPTPGMVVINWPEVATMTGGPTGQRVSVYMHELGHAFGLGHANSPQQVMHAQMTTANTHGVWGAGDAEGLRRLGQGQCPAPTPATRPAPTDDTEFDPEAQPRPAAA